MKKLSLLLVALTFLLASCKPEAEKPTVVTKSVGEVTETTAKVVGQVTADGGAEVTERGVCWNTDGSPIVIDYRTVDGKGIGTYESDMTNLKDNTTYYVRAYATNEKGVSYGEEMTLTTLKEIELPTVTTANVKDIIESEAVSGGEVVSDGGAEVTARGICWSTKQNPTIEDDKTTDGSGVGTFASEMTDLEADTKYYVRAYATNEKGTAYGEEVSFTTEEPEEPENPEQPEDPENPENPENPEDPETPEQPEDPENPENPETPEQPEQPVGPVVITAEVTEITVNSAKCGGGISDGGGASVVERGVCWNTSGNPTVLDIRVKDVEGGLGTYISNITGLEHNTTYYVRAYAVNANGVAGYGPEVSFTTLEKLLPTVTTATEVTDITVRSAKCGGEVTFNGNVSVTARGICWSTMPNPTIDDNKRSSGGGVGTYTSNMINLEHNTTYYVRAYATNEVGTAYGEEVTFTTLEKLLPTVTTITDVTKITASSAVCGGEVTFDGNDSETARGICWSTSQNPTIEDNKTENGSGIGSYTSYMTGLERNTTYYVRAYATNEVGTVYGEEVSFTSMFLETISTLTSDYKINLSNCTGTVKCYGDYWNCGYCNWEITFECNNSTPSILLNLDFLTDSNIDGSSGFEGIYRSSGFMEEDPTQPAWGEFKFIPGFSIGGNAFMGSMLVEYSIGGIAVEQAPIFNGEIIINDNGDGTHTIVINATDDLWHDVTLNWTGILQK